MRPTVLLLVFVLICIIILSLKKKNIDEYNQNINYNKLNKLNNKCNQNLLIYSKYNNKMTLNNTKKNKYQNGILPIEIKKDLDTINNLILNSINKNYHNTGYSDVILEEDNNKNRRYIYDVFIHDKKENLDLKLKIDLIKLFNKHNKNNNKLIPSPMEIISIPNKMLKVNKNKLHNYDNDIKFIHVNSIQIFNSVLHNKIKLINTNNVEKNIINNNSNFKGEFKSELEVSNIKGSNNPYIQKSVITNKWPLNNNKFKLVIKKHNKWDDMGVYKSYNLEYIQSKISNYPTMNKVMGNEGIYKDLFKKSNTSGIKSSYISSFN